MRFQHCYLPLLGQRRHSSPASLGSYPLGHNDTFFEALSRSLHPYYTWLHTPARAGARRFATDLLAKLKFLSRKTDIPC